MSDIKDKYKDIKTSGGLFLKINDGETVKVRIFSDPVYFDNEFKGQLTSRFAWVVWNQDSNSAQIWQTNGATYDMIKTLALDDEYGDPTQYDIKISRTGVEQKTRYSVIPGQKRYDLPKEAVEQCEKVDIIAMISKSDSTQHVMWMEEHREEKAAKEIYAKKQVEEAMDIEDVSDEPVDLDSIPF